MLDRSLIRLEGMRKLIFDLLDLTRIESGQKAAESRGPRRAGPRPGRRRLVHARGVRTGHHHDPRSAEPVAMVADPGELEIIFNNLVSNAVKYNRDGGTVTVTVSREDDVVRIGVTDTGIGMTPEESAKLFNEFVRIKNEDTFKIIGSGLGLSTVRKLAQLYGGDASVKSERGVGSSFIVNLRDETPLSSTSLVSSGVQPS